MKIFNQLRVRLMLLVAMATLPLLFNALYAYRQGNHDARAAVEQNIRSLLRSTLLPETIVVDNMHQMLRIMANADELSELDPADCVALAGRLLKAQTSFSNMGMANKAGDITCSGKASTGRVNAADRGWFKRAMAQPGFSSGEYLTARISGERVVTFGYPLPDPQGQPRAVLFGAVRLDWLQQVVSQAELPPGYVAAVFSVDGYVIARHPDPEGLRGKTLSAPELMQFIKTRPAETLREIEGADGVRRILGIAPLKIASGDIYLVVGAPPDVAFADLNREFQSNLLLSLLVALASFALGWWAIERDYLKFSSILTAVIDRMRQGDLSARYGTPSQIAELNTIATGFDRMAAELERLDQQHHADAVALREMHTVFDALVNSTDSFIYVFDLAGRCQLANRALAEFIGQSSQSLLGQARSQMLAAETAQQLDANDQQVIATGVSVTLEEQVQGPDQSLRKYLTVKFPLHNTAGKIYAVGGISTDITERQRAASEQTLAAMVFAESAEGIIITDAEHRMLKINRRFSEITGYSESEAIGQTPRLLSSGQHDEVFYQQLWQEIKASGHWQGEITNRRKDGSTYPEWLSISSVNDAEGKISHYFGLFSDLTQRKALDQHVQQLLNFDALTSLPNRSLFVDRLQQALRVAERTKQNVAVFWIDLARFRVINDTFGHATGDMVLIEVSQRLRNVVRGGDTAARLSADEFGVLMIDGDQEHHVAVMAQRLLDEISQPMEINGQMFGVAANIGISVFSKDGANAEELLKAADVALARAKDAGRDTFRFFAAGMDIDAERRLRLEAELRNALSGEQLCLHYQPQIDLATGRVNGLEALIRWTHPVMGPISPVEFIPIAEEAALIAPIGQWVLRTACQQNKQWIDAGLPPLPVAVNLSARQFHQADLVEMIKRTLDETGLPPALLEIELTESAFMGDIDQAAITVNRIKALGVLLALDDFGTGYSSLSYLSGFPFDKIKIDQSFVHDITTNPVNAAIAIATIAMARSLDLVVLAEGVETDAQMNFLRSRQCEAMQGHLFSKALPVAELTDLLASQRALNVAGNAPLKRPTLLLVDDEESILSSLKRLLRQENFDVLTANSPQAAFELLAQHEVQVIISDQRMPGMNGTEFLERTKKLYPNTVRIILSGYTDLASITEAINRGAIYHFMTKPWDDDKIKAEVREAFRVAQGFARA